MKLTKLSIITVCLIFFVNMCQSAQYYCGDNPMVSYNSVNLYYSDKTAEQYCSWLKTDIIISDIPIKYTYKQCVSDFNAAKAKYEKGKCTPVITKNYIWNGYKCQVNSIQGTSLVIKTSCNTDKPNVSESAMDYFQRLYRKQFGIYYIDDD